MIIYNCYIFIWYGSWLYFLLCLCVKVYIDYNKRKHSVRKQHHIHQFFFAYSGYMDKRASKQILRYSKDDLLFAYICECYFHLKQLKQNKINYEINILMNKIFKQKLRMTPKNDFLLRKFIFKNMYKFEAKNHDDCKIKNNIKITSDYIKQKESKNAYYN